MLLFSSGYRMRFPLDKVEVPHHNDQVRAHPTSACQTYLYYHDGAKCLMSDGAQPES